MKIILKWRCLSIIATNWVPKSMILYCSFFHTTSFLFLKLVSLYLSGSTAYLKCSLYVYMYMIISLEHSVRMIMICLSIVWLFWIQNLSTERCLPWRRLWFQISLVLPDHYQQHLTNRKSPHPKHSSAIDLFIFRMMYCCWWYIYLVLLTVGNVLSGAVLQSNEGRVGSH